MLSESLFFRVFLLFFNKLGLFYGNSVLSKIVNRVFQPLMRVWRESFIHYALFSDFSFNQKFRDGIFGKITKTEDFLEFTSSRCKNAFSESAFFSSVCGFLKTLPYCSSSSYGIFFAITGGLLFFNKTSVYAAAAFLGLGILLLIINRPVIRLFEGSFILKVAMGFFTENAEKTVKAGNTKKAGFYVFAAAGVVFGLLGAFLPLNYFMLVFGGAIGCILVFYNTLAGVYALAFFIPLLPTKFILALSVPTVFSFFFKAVFTGSEKIKIRLLDFFMLLFMLIILFSAAVSYKPSSSAVVSFTYTLFIFVYFVFKNVVNTKERLYTVISLFCVSGFLVALLGIYQRVTGDFTSAAAWIDSGMFENTGGRVYSTLGNPNVLGEYLLFVIPMCVATLYYMKNSAYKIFSVVMLAALTLCMALTLSRGAWLGLIVAAAVFVFLKDRKLLWFGVIGLLLLPFVMPDSIVERFMSIGNMSDGSTSYRVYIWLASLAMIKTFWLSGIGMGTDSFAFVYRKFSYNAVYAPHSHNLYLQIMIDLGIGGFCIFVLMLAASLKNLLLASKGKSKFISTISAALCAGILGYLTQGMTDYVFYNYRVVLYFMVILAISGCTYNLKETK